VTDILVVGSVALDTIRTPAGEAENVLGGSAVYFGLAARHYGTVHPVAVVGRDFPAEHLKLLADCGIDTRGIAVVDGETFRWSGVYSADPNDRETLSTELNVFKDFDPVLSAAERACPVVFLANIDPRLQFKVLEQVMNPRLVVMDTMNYWIDRQREDLLQVFERIHILIVNDSEARQLTGFSNLVEAAEKILAMGPRWVIVKKGEHGALLVGGDVYFSVPAYPVRRVVDPTGAGDSFAGGVVGYLAAESGVSDPALRRALVVGTVLASFTVESFSIDRLHKVTAVEIEERYEEIRRITTF